MDISLIELTYGYGYYGIELKTMIDNKAKYFDVRVKLQGLTLIIDEIGIAPNKNKNYKYIHSRNDKYRGAKGLELMAKVRKDILKQTPPEVLTYALEIVYKQFKIEDDWIIGGIINA